MNVSRIANEEYIAVAIGRGLAMMKMEAGHPGRIAQTNGACGRWVD
jgi:hypothetical protein